MQPGSDRSVSMRAAVIGLGAMGRHHVRILGALDGVKLVAVADVSSDAVARSTSGTTLAGYTDIERMLDEVQPDLVTIVVPTSLHLAWRCMAIDRGIHCLVEKPIAGTVADAWSMIRAAERAGVKLMVGHIERFNPAIVELKQRIAQVGTIYQVSARRVGPFPERIRDVGVVVDLASHDIDAMNFILETSVEHGLRADSPANPHVARGHGARDATLRERHHRRAGRQLVDTDQGAGTDGGRQPRHVCRQLPDPGSGVLRERGGAG